MEKKSNKIINAGLGYTLGNILIKGISFLTIPLYTRLMTTGDYGLYNTYVAYVGIVTFLVCLGLDPTLKNAEQDFSEHKGTYLSTVYILTLAATTVLLGLLFFFGNQLEKVVNIDAILLIMMVINAEAAAIINIYNIKLSLSYSSRRYLGIACFQTICGIGLSVTLMLTIFDQKRYVGRIVGTMIPALLVSGVILFRSVIKMHTDKRFDLKMARYSLKLGLPLIPHLLAQIINAQFDRIMISKLVGYAKSGIYSFTYNIAVILQIVYQSLESVWSPWFFQQMASRNYDQIKRSSRKYIALVAFLTVSLMTISNEFIMVFSTEEYWEGKAIVLTLIEGIFFLYLYTFPVGVEHYTKHTKYIALGSILAAALNIVMNYYGIRRYGYEAAAYTTLICYIVMFILHWRNAMRFFPLKTIFDIKWIIAMAIFVVSWGTLCRYTQNAWLIRYAAYVVILILFYFYFRAEINTYFHNLKSR